MKPELMQSVLEIATTPCEDVAAAGRGARGRCAAPWREIAAERGAAARPPPAPTRSRRWEDQQIVDRPRYQELVDELGFIARQELIFGTHVHVGDRRPRPAIYVADGHPPLPAAAARALGQLARSGAASATGLMSSRTPVFRAFPRAGIPPHYGTWEIYSNRVEQMMRGGAIDDYTYLWWDVRPHPNLGTVETRIFDQQTHARAHDRPGGADDLASRTGSAPSTTPSSRWSSTPPSCRRQQGARGRPAAWTATLIDFWRGEQVPAEQIGARVLVEAREPRRGARLRRRARRGRATCSSDSTGAHRQLRHCRAQRRPHRARPRDRTEQPSPEAAARAVRRLFSWSCQRQAPS